MTYAVEIQNLSKSFRLYQEKYSSLKERVVHAGHIPYDEFWALKDIDAAFETGLTIGMLGRNGSGKSTLLKCIAGILQPTSGQVVVRGKIASMLELGAGFESDLSGRDNVFLNGTLLVIAMKRLAKHRQQHACSASEIAEEWDFRHVDGQGAAETGPAEFGYSEARFDRRIPTGEGARESVCSGSDHGD